MHPYPLPPAHPGRRAAVGPICLQYCSYVDSLRRPLSVAWQSGIPLFESKIALKADVLLTCGDVCSTRSPWMLTTGCPTQQMLVDANWRSSSCPAHLPCSEPSRRLQDSRYSRTSISGWGKNTRQAPGYRIIPLLQAPGYRIIPLNVAHSASETSQNAQKTSRL
jgi:hypothetical protein